MPGVINCKSKPEPVAMQFWNVADVSSGIVLFCEINEGQDRNKAKRYRDVYSAQPALALRLSEYWHGSGRVFYADSYFSSVVTAMALIKHGLHFSGIIKQAHKYSPKNFLVESLDSDEVAKGTSLFYMAEFLEKSAIAGGAPASRKLLCVGHKDVKIKVIISSTGNTLPAATDHYRKYEVLDPLSGEARQVSVGIPRAQIMAQHFDNVGKTDLSNRMRQGFT
jgi:hypothetical protein